MSTPGPEPTDAEIVGGEYQPYRSHPAGGEVAPTSPAQHDSTAVDRADAPTSELLELEKQERNQSFVLGIVSLGTGIPITAIAATNVEPGLLGVAVAWAGIVGVNVAHRLTNRKRRS